MFSLSPWQRLQKRWKFLFVIGIFFALLSLTSLFVLPLEYRADAEVLIISQTRAGVDPYTVVKSAERVGENIAQVMKTKDFYEKVRSGASGSGINWQRFGTLETRTQRKEWEQSLQGSVVFGTAVLHVSAYSSKKDEAAALANAGAAALVKDGWEYAGGDVTIKLVNNAIVTDLPARPNVVLNAALGFFVGAFIAGLFVTRKHI